MSAEAPAFHPGEPFQLDEAHCEEATTFGEKLVVFPPHLLDCIEECLSEASPSAAHAARPVGVGASRKRANGEAVARQVGEPEPRGGG